MTDKNLLQATDDYYTFATATAVYVFFYILYVLIKVTIKLVMFLSYKMVQRKCGNGIDEYKKWPMQLDCMKIQIWAALLTNFS